MGDPMGIGWILLKEIISNGSQYLKEKELQEMSHLVMIGDLLMLEESQVKKYFHVTKYPKQQTELLALLQNKKRKKPLFLFLKKIEHYTLGQSTSAMALRSYIYFQKAMKLWMDLPVASLITLPVSKEFISRSGVSFVGHTEILENTFGNKAVMCMYHPTLSVIPLTHHIPISQVANEILHIDFEQIMNALEFFAALLRIKKGVALTGLNPHAGENGKIGNEESFLSQKLRNLKNRQINIVGPLSADGLFAPESRKHYSVILSTYHDQGLAPFKALFGTKGINITLNLPKLRVSPDHGPAYDKAITNGGDVTSVLNSLRFAIRWGKKWTQIYSSIF